MKQSILIFSFLLGCQSTVHLEQSQSLLKKDFDFQKYNQGQEIYQRRCLSCHQLPPADAFQAQQWAVIVENMQKRMLSARQEALSQQQKEDVLFYLQNFTKQK